VAVGVQNPIYPSDQIGKRQWVGSGVAFVVLLLIEARKATVRVRHRVAEASEWLRTHVPETGVSDWLRDRSSHARDSSAELAALRDEPQVPRSHKTPWGSRKRKHTSDLIRWNYWTRNPVGCQNPIHIW
jgi:hypothetical protein